MGPLLNPKTLISRAPRTQNRSQLVADLWASSGGSRWALAKRQKARDQVAMLAVRTEPFSPWSRSVMSALHPEAGILSVEIDVRKVPIADTVPKPRKGTASAISIQPGLILLFCRFDIGKIVGAEPGSDVPLQLRWPCESNPPVPERLPEANIAHPNSR